MLTVNNIYRQANCSDLSRVSRQLEKFATPQIDFINLENIKLPFFPIFF